MKICILLLCLVSFVIVSLDAHQAFFFVRGCLYVVQFIRGHRWRKMTATFDLTWKFLIICNSIISPSAMAVQLTVDLTVEKYRECILFFSPKHHEK